MGSGNRGHSKRSYVSSTIRSLRFSVEEMRRLVLINGMYDQPHVFNACIIGIMNHLVMSVITDLLSIGSKRVNDTCAYPGAWFTEFPGGSPVDHNPITGYQP